MRNSFFYLLLSLFSLSISAQVKSDKYVIVDGDTLYMLRDTIHLDEVQISRVKMDAETKKQFLLLQNRVYRTYPYAKTTAERLKALNANMAKLKTNREKKKYFKIAEDYLENEFKPQLKKLSTKQGQILVKLIHRQTGVSTYDLIKDYKSGWKAFWSNNTASLFNINLKTKYEPFQVNEDYWIEVILQRAFNRGRLVEQKPANPIDFDELNTFWENKAIELNTGKKKKKTKN